MIQYSKILDHTDFLNRHNVKQIRLQGTMQYTFSKNDLVMIKQIKNIRGLLIFHCINKSHRHFSCFSYYGKYCIVFMRFFLIISRSFYEAVYITMLSWRKWNRKSCCKGFKLLVIDINHCLEC